jgi:hypothetical protein
VPIVTVFSVSLEAEGERGLWVVIEASACVASILGGRENWFAGVVAGGVDLREADFRSYQGACTLLYTGIPKAEQG